MIGSTAFKAQHPGQCKRCGNNFEPGTIIRRMSSGYGYEHDACPTKKQEPLNESPFIDEASTPIYDFPSHLMPLPTTQSQGLRGKKQAEAQGGAEVAGLGLGLRFASIDLQSISTEERPQQEKAKAPSSLMKVPEGTFTVILGSGGGKDYRTLRIQRQPEDHAFAPGKLIISYLNGPDNYVNYKGFGFVNEEGQLFPWKKFLLTSTAQAIIDAANILLNNPYKAGEAYAIQSGKCWHCGKKLTVPASIAQGLGPICASKLGVTS